MAHEITCPTCGCHVESHDGDEGCQEDGCRTPCALSRADVFERNLAALREAVVAAAQQGRSIFIAKAGNPVVEGIYDGIGVDDTWLGQPNEHPAVALVRWHRETHHA